MAPSSSLSLAHGWDLVLDTQVLAAPAATHGPFTIEQYAALWIHIYIAGYAGGAIAQLRFNNDSGANYASTNVDGATTLAETSATPSSGLKIAAIAITGPRSVWVKVTRNYAGKVKHAVIEGDHNSEAAATAPTRSNGAGIWVGTAPIVQLGLQAAANMNALTTITAFGRNDIGF